MIPSELHLALDFRSGGDPASMSHWLKAYNAPCRPRVGDFVNDDAAPEREELLCVHSMTFNVNSGRLTVVLDPVEPESMDEYLDRMRELRAGGWHELEDWAVYDNPLPPVNGWALEWRLRLHSTVPAPDGGTCWTKTTVEPVLPTGSFFSPGIFRGLLGEGTGAPLVEVLTVCRASGKLAAVAEGYSSSRAVGPELLAATGWKPLPAEVRRMTALTVEEYGTQKSVAADSQTEESTTAEG